MTFQLRGKGSCRLKLGIEGGWAYPCSSQVDTHLLAVWSRSVCICIMYCKAGIKTLQDQSSLHWSILLSLFCFCSYISLTGPTFYAYVSQSVPGDYGSQRMGATTSFWQDWACPLWAWWKESRLWNKLGATLSHSIQQTSLSYKLDAKVTQQIRTHLYSKAYLYA